MRLPKAGNSAYCQQYKLTTKIKCMAVYGSACARCGFSDIRALQIDHKYEAPKEKQGDYHRGGTGLYLLILSGTVPKEDYQCLCANCNWIKRYENERLRSRNKNSRYFRENV